VLAIHHADSRPPGPTESGWLKLYFPTDLTVQELNDRRRNVCDNVVSYREIVAAASKEEEPLNIIVMSDWERDHTELYQSYPADLPTIHHINGLPDYVWEVLCSLRREAPPDDWHVDWINTVPVEVLEFAAEFFLLMSRRFSRYTRCAGNLEEVAAAQASMDLVHLHGQFAGAAQLRSSQYVSPYSEYLALFSPRVATDATVSSSAGGSDGLRGETSSGGNRVQNNDVGQTAGSRGSRSRGSGSGSSDRIRD
ncbi:hypothetical protein SeLEV6574_g07486, partial [Synchytrium endobioticum]